MSSFASLIEKLSTAVWGWPMIILLLGTHIYMTFRLRFPQLKVGKAIKISVTKDKGAQGDVSQFGALATALAATIGAEMDYLAAACAPVFRSHQDQIMVLDRSRIQRYSRYDRQFWYYDIDDFVGRIATDSEYRKFISALDRAVIYKDATDRFLSIDILHYSGLSIYIPRPEYTILNNFYKTLQWNSATGLVM